MNHRLPALATVLALSLSAAALPAPATAVAKPVKEKADKAPKGSYAGANGRKNH